MASCDVSHLAKHHRYGLIGYRYGVSSVRVEHGDAPLPADVEVDVLDAGTHASQIF